MLGSLLTFFAVGLLTLIVAGVVLAVVGSVVGLVGSLAAFLLFKIAPLMLVGWVVVKLLQRRSPDRISSADRRWLEGD
jgi:ABC-type xylose transport system permease subunit